MEGLERKVASEERRLVLGFDAGCGTCTDLALGVEEAAGGKLSVRALGDPEVAGWRKRALGEAAPWAPTLFAIEGDRVKAWTGRRMAVALGRLLGPMTSWRVLQALGGAASPSIEPAISGITRTQFIKGVGGVTVAMSVLSGLTFAPSVAHAVSAGTKEQRARAVSIVRASAAYKSLADLQSRVDAPFALGKAEIIVSAPRARVAIASPDKSRGVAAIFFVNLAQEKVLSYNNSMATPARNGTAIRSTKYLNGRPQRYPYHKATIGDNWVVTEDNRLISHGTYEAELSRLEQGGANSLRSRGPNAQCHFQNENFCKWGLGVAGSAALGLALTPFVTPVGGALVAVGAAALTNLACDRLIATCDQMYPPAAVKPQPPKYYCE